MRLRPVQFVRFLGFLSVTGEFSGFFWYSSYRWKPGLATPQNRNNSFLLKFFFCTHFSNADEDNLQKLIFFCCRSSTYFFSLWANSKNTSRQCTEIEQWRHRAEEKAFIVLCHIFTDSWGNYNSLQVQLSWPSNEKSPQNRIFSC